MKGNKPIRVIVSVENGVVYPVIKVCNHDSVEVIIVNTDRSSIWKPSIQYNCDREIERLSLLADQLKGVVNEAGERVKK